MNRQDGRGTTVPPGRIDLHIEELVFHGFAPGDRRQIGEVIERELTRLVSEQGLPGRLSEGGTIDRLDGGVFKMSPQAEADEVGMKVAQAIYGGLTE